MARNVFNQYTLKAGAREKLAKVAGILLAYPGLKVQLEGHTDSVGSDDYNMKLSQQRADSVRTYVVSQGVPTETVTAVGLGRLILLPPMTMPPAPSKPSCGHGSLGRAHGLGSLNQQR